MGSVAANTHTHTHETQSPCSVLLSTLFHTEVIYILGTCTS